jgi:hypothetical protein
MASEHYQSARGSHAQDAHWCFNQQQRLLRKLVTRWPRDAFGIRNSGAGHPGYSADGAFQQAGPRSRSPSTSEEGEQRDRSSSVDNEKSSTSEVTSYGTVDGHPNSKRNVQYYSYYSFPPISQAEEGIDVRHDQIIIRTRQQSRQTLAVCLCHLASMMIFF